MGEGRLICLEGGDASGKTTLAELLALRLGEHGLPARFIAKNAPKSGAFALQRHLELLGNALWCYPEDAPVGSWGEPHWFYLLASWFSLLDEACVRPALRAGEWVIVDGWSYKFRARFGLKPSFQTAAVEHAFAHLSRPDLIVVPELAPELAALRRSHLKPSECGRFDGHDSSDPRVAFAQYQRRVLSAMERLYDAPVVRVQSQEGRAQELSHQLAATIVGHLSAVGSSSGDALGRRCCA